MSYLVPIKSQGKHYLLAVGSVSVADTDTIDTGINSIVSAVVCHGASTTIAGTDSAFDATISGITDGTITVTVIARQTTPALAAYATTATVYFVAVGT